MELILESCALLVYGLHVDAEHVHEGIGELAVAPSPGQLAAKRMLVTLTTL